MRVERDKHEGWLSWVGNNKVKTIEQYTMDGSIHNKPITVTISSNGKSKHVSKQSEVQKEQEDSWVPVLVLTLAPSVSNIPFVGWVAAGWVTMFSGNQGAEIGGSMAEDLNKDC